MTYVDRGTSKKLTGVNHDIEFRHNPNSKRTPEGQDAMRWVCWGKEGSLPPL
jgi:hypothetical protein